jgi:hypothetical protein
VKHITATLATGLLTTLVALGAATPAVASTSGGGCPTGWQLVLASQFPPLTGGNVDLNGDGLICIMSPVTNPTALSSEPFGAFDIHIDNNTPLS